MLLLRKGWFFFSFVVMFDPSLGVSTDDGIYWGWHMEMVPLPLMLLRTLVWWIRWCPWTKQESFLTIKERSMYSRWIHLGTWWSKGASEQILLQSRCALSAIWTRKVILWFHNSTLALYHLPSFNLFDLIICWLQKLEWDSLSIYLLPHTEMYKSGQWTEPPSMDGSEWASNGGQMSWHGESFLENVSGSAHVLFFCIHLFLLLSCIGHMPISGVLLKYALIAVVNNKSSSGMYLRQESSFGYRTVFHS